MDLNVLGQWIQTLGFPVACVIALGVYMYKFTNRIQDENKAREEAYQKREESYQGLLLTYGEKMAEISSALERITSELDEMRK